jgi:ribosomal protein S6--L-glutamate ligase
MAMRVVILSRQPALYSTRVLVEAGQARGHEMQVLDTLLFDIRISKRSPELFYEGEPVEGVDAVIPRIGASITFYGLAVVRQFEMMGVYCVNESQAIARSRDKLRSLQLLSRHDIGMPPTVFTRQAANVPLCIERVDGPPVVVKLLQGTQGIGVVLAESTAAASSVIEAFHGLDQNILIQQFIREANGSDIRALVVGRRVVAAMRRQAVAGEFRSNIHRGGKAKKVTLSGEYRRTALAAARVLGLRVAGVDLIESAQGPMVMEVNSSPGLEGIQKATGADVAAAIIEHIEREVTPAARHGR